MTVQEAYQAFTEADARWSKDLDLAFGEHAGDQRYTTAGETHPSCVSSYRDFVRARAHWYQSVFQWAAGNHTD